MRLDLKILLILVGLAYLISPLDIIPDYLLPLVGWIDDGVILWAIIHLIRHGKLPGFSRGAKSRPTPEQEIPRAGANNGKRSPSPGNPYDILGIPRDASWDQIQAAYKEGIKKYHPDKVAHLGDEFAQLANEKFLDIQDAFNALKNKRRG